VSQQVVNLWFVQRRGIAAAPPPRSRRIDGFRN
jgi:hypothetical protein